MQKLCTLASLLSSLYFLSVLDQIFIYYLYINILALVIFKFLSFNFILQLKVIYKSPFICHTSKYTNIKVF
jgi:hypothetical protein